MPLVSIQDLRRAKEEVADFEDLAGTLSQLYDDFVEADEGDGHKRAAGIHASELSCERRMAYTVLGAKKKNKVNKTMRQRFQMGKLIHSLIQEDFAQLARKSRGRIHFEAEVPIHPDLQPIAAELQLYSSCDGVFTFREHVLGPAVLRVGLEIKTEAPDGYEKLTGPKPDHLEQGHLYMKALDLPLMYFLYMNKGNQNNTPSVSPYLARFNEEIWLTVEKKCRAVLEASHTVRRMTLEGATEVADHLPARNEGFYCTFCPYSHTCEPSYAKPKAGGGAASWRQPRSG